jgi:hypothetical protein
MLSQDRVGLTNGSVGEPGEADGAAARPGWVRQPGAVWAGVCAGGMPTEALAQGIPAEDVLLGKFLLAFGSVEPILNT